MTLIDTDPFTRRIIGCAIEVHRTLGPGLIESVYETCLCDELTQANLTFTRERRLPLIYKTRKLNADMVMDIVVEDAVVLEVKSVQAILPVHSAQLLTYLKLGNIPIGLLINFNGVRLIDGVRRLLLPQGER